MIRYCHTVDKPATTTKSRRIVVRFAGGRSVTVAWDYTWPDTLVDAHRAAVKAAIKELDGTEYDVALAGISRHGYRFNLHELVTDRALAVWLADPAPVA